MSPKLVFRKVAGLTLAAAFVALIAAGSARAELPGQDQVPANALMAFGIPDTGKFWSRAGALSLTQAIDQFMGSQQVASSMAYQQFNLERQKLEQKLGFPATPQELLGSVFANALITLEPRAQGKPSLNVTLGVKDPAKGAKVAAALDEMFRQMAAETAQTSPTAAAAVPATPGTPAAAPAPADKVAFESLDLSGAKASHVHYQGGGPAAVAQDVYYALAGDRLVFSSGREELGRLIQKTKPAQGIGANAEFAKLTNSIPWGQADVAGWLDSAAILELTSNKMVQMMRGMIPSQSEKIAFALEVAPDGLVGQVASSQSPVQAGGPLKPRKLTGMAYLSPTPMLALVYGMLDAEESYKNFNSFLSALSLAGSMSGQAGAAPASNPLADVEQKLGISIQNDLVPALGTEALLSLNGLQINMMGGGMPNVDFVLGVEVRDQAKMRAVMAKLEAWLETTMAGMGGAPPASAGAGVAGNPAPPKFQNVPGAAAIRSITTSQPMLGPTWAMAGNYLLIGLNLASVQSALGRAGQAGAAGVNPAYAELTRMAGTDQIFSFSVVDVRQATQTILMPLLSILMMTNQGKMSVQDQANISAIVTNILPKIGTAASLETVKDGVALGFMKIKM